MDKSAELGNALPLVASLPVIALATILLLMTMQRLPSTAGRFVLFAIWLRIVLAAYHEFTFDPSPLGLSWNALASVLATAIGFLIVRRRALSWPALTPFVPLICEMVVSGITNAAVPSLLTVLTKYAYLIILILAVVDALGDIGPKRLFSAVVLPFALAIILQFESVVLGVSKATETDGSISYIGGFNHEAAFSVTLAAAVLAICLVRSGSLRVKFLLIGIGFAGIFLASYRTAILAVLPLVGIVLISDIPQRFVRSQRGVIVGLISLTVASVALIGAISARERFADLGAIITGEAVLIQRPELFSEVEGDLMSGRAFIWSQYYYGWADADAIHRAVGFGPETYENYFSIYAHNTLVNALFETGVLGTLALLFLWIWMLALSLRVRDSSRSGLVAGHLSFLILNMATMPMWMIEGMIFYGLLCGYTVWAFNTGRQSPSV